MEDLFDTFNRLTQLRTRENRTARTQAGFAKRRSSGKNSSHSQELFREALKGLENDSKADLGSRWFDLDHAIARNIDRKADELDFSPGPLEDGEDSEEIGSLGNQTEKEED
jgi:hypothetical protein